MLNAKCLLPIYLPSRAKLRFIFIFPLPTSTSYSLSCSWIRLLFSFWKHDTRRIEKTNKIHAEKKATALDAIDWAKTVRLDKRIHLRNEHSKIYIDEIVECACVCAGLPHHGSEWEDAETRDYFEESFGRHKIRLWLQLGPIIHTHRWRRLNTKINIIQRLVETDEIRIAGIYWCAR